MGEVFILVVITVVIIWGMAYFWLDSRDMLPKIPQKGPMYPKILARNGKEWIEREKDTWNVCAICRYKYVPTLNSKYPAAQIGFNHVTGNF